MRRPSLSRLTAYKAMQPIIRTRTPVKAPEMAQKPPLKSTIGLWSKLRSNTASAFGGSELDSHTAFFVLRARRRLFSQIRLTLRAKNEAVEVIPAIYTILLCISKIFDYLVKYYTLSFIVIRRRYVRSSNHYFHEA